MYTFEPTSCCNGVTAQPGRYEYTVTYAVIYEYSHRVIESKQFKQIYFHHHSNLRTKMEKNGMNAFGDNGFVVMF